MRSNRDEEREKTNISLSSERRPANRICLLSLSSIEPSRIWARTMSTKSMVQTCRAPLKKVKNENGISRPERNSTSKANFLTKKNELSRQSSEGFRCCRITEWKTTSICLSADSAFSEIEKTSDERAFDLFERFPSARWFNVTTVFFFRSQRISSQMSSVLQEPIGRSTNDRTVLVESSPIVESFSRQETSQIETKLDFELDWLRPERWTKFAERRWVTELSIDRTNRCSASENHFQTNVAPNNESKQIFPLGQKFNRTTINEIIEFLKENCSIRYFESRFVGFP